MPLAVRPSEETKVDLLVRSTGNVSGSQDKTIFADDDSAAEGKSTMSASTHADGNRGFGCLFGGFHNLGLQRIQILMAINDNPARGGRSRVDVVRPGCRKKKSQA